MLFSFVDRLPMLYQLLVGHLNQELLEVSGMSESEVMRQWIRDAPDTYLMSLLNEVDEAIKVIDLSWKGIGQFANVYFEQPEQASAWLEEVVAKPVKLALASKAK